MNQVAPISLAVKDLFTNSTTVPLLIPGGLLYGIEKAKTTRPFASLTIDLEGEPLWQTGLIYVQDYAVEIGVWSSQALADSLAIQTALEAMIGMRTKLGGLPNNAWTLQCVLDPAGIVEPEERFKGQFTFVAGARWIISLQETRNAG